MDSLYTMNVEELYLQLLREGLLGKQDSALNPQDVQSLIYLCRIQGTEAIVYERLLTRSASCIPAESLAYMKGVCARNMISFERLKGVLKHTFLALEDAGIKPVLLKGFGLSTLYPQPWLRTWGDLDVYVGPNQYHEAAAVLRATYPEAIHHDEEWEELKHYNFNLPDGNVIEMHRRTMAHDSVRDKKVFFALEEAAMQECEYVDVEGFQLRVPEYKFNVLFVFMHAWEHFYEQGAGWKQLSDVALLVTKHTHNPSLKGREYPELEDYLRQNLKKLYLMGPWRIMSYVIVKALQLDPQQWPLYDDSRWTKKHGELLYAKILNEGLARPKEHISNAERNERRNQARKMWLVKRKWITMTSRFRLAATMYSFAPAYTLHRLWGSITKGIRRTLSGAKMIDY